TLIDNGPISGEQVTGSIRRRDRALYLRYRPPGQSRQIEESFPRIEGESMPDYRKRAQVAGEGFTGTGLWLEGGSDTPND
ncbi:MAG: hypothetical protein VCF24_28115, partial [Candidatus Latescibacterota bacterium]